MPAARFLVSGKVQGVFYRASAREQALALSLVGYAKNLPDGRVEVIVRGAESAIEALERWLWIGPAAARVDDVVRDDYAGADLSNSFVTR
jgi:acylphosphatase